MARHILSLEIPDTMNNCILRIEDTSNYAQNIPVTCPTLQVLLPGFVKAVTFNSATTPLVEDGFRFTLNACDLGIQIQDCGTVQNPLSDGIYVIRYSVSPNDLVYVEYNHLRITSALERYKKLLCALDLSGCEPSLTQSNRLKDLMVLKGYLESAKAKVELCNEPEKGMVLYNYALKKLNAMACVNC
jgi:hypothetical protein